MKTKNVKQLLLMTFCGMLWYSSKIGATKPLDTHTNDQTDVKVRIVLYKEEPTRICLLDKNFQVFDCQSLPLPNS